VKSIAWLSHIGLDDPVIYPLRGSRSDGAAADPRGAVPAARQHIALASASALALLALVVSGAAGALRPSEIDQAPQAPGNVRVTAATPTTFSLAWDAATDDVGVQEYVVVAGDERSSTSHTTYVARRVACGQSFHVSVTAYDTSGNRSPAATATVSTAACTDTRAPSPPAGFRQRVTTQDAVVLEWSASVDEVGVVGYGLYLNGLRVQSPSEPVATLVGLDCGSTYSYLVDAVDAAGNRSQSRFAWVRTLDCERGGFGPTPPVARAASTVSGQTQPTPPTDLSAWGITQSTVKLAWRPATDDVGVTAYDVYRLGAKVASVDTTSAVQNGLACGTSYWFGVEAVDGSGNRSERTRVNANTLPCASDQLPPAPPSNLTASGITDSGLTLVWSPATDDVGVTTYDVYRMGTKVDSVTSTSSDQQGLKCGTEYWFGVEAVDAAGNRSARTRVNPRTRPCPAPPVPPSDTTAPSQPTNVAVASATATSVSLRWGASTDDVGVVGYGVYVNGNMALAPAQPGATVSSLRCGTAYSFEVDAVDAARNRSSRAKVTASTAACADGQAPSVPTGVVSTSRTATSIALSWSASTDNVGVTGYGLYRNGSLVGTSATTSGIFSGLTCNANYTLAVDAYDAAANRSGKATLMVATTACADTTAPSVPANLAASSITQSSLTLTWAASTDNVGVAGYDVFRNGTKMATVTSTSAGQTGLACGTLYNFGVEAFDAGGNRSARAHVSPTTSSCSNPPPPPTGLYYVDPNGSDAGNGSQARPWRTIAKACASVPAGAGNTIRVNAGTYVESVTCFVPCNTNLQGAGRGSTTVKGTADPLISVQNCTAAGNAQTISGLKLDGQNRTTGVYGMKADHTRGLTITDMEILGFRGPPDAGGGALNIRYAWNLELANLHLRNSARDSGGACSGTLGLGEIHDSRIHDLTISEDVGYGVKNSMTDNGSYPAVSNMTNTEFSNLDVQALSGRCATWNTLAFELFRTEAVNVVIRNSRFNRVMSLISGSGPLSSGVRYRIHNNEFNLPTGGDYAIELHTHSSEVDHNYFNGGLYPIADFSTLQKSGNIIHHNVFDNQSGPTAAMHLTGGLANARFYNNTVVLRQPGWRDGVFSFGEAVGYAGTTTEIRNNIFFSTQPIGDKLGLGLDSSTIDRNGFHNIAPRGTNAIAGNPQLSLSGGFPGAYVPSPGSAVAGLGAFANGQWSVGPG
jgi:chitodextrinase